MAIRRYDHKLPSIGIPCAKVDAVPKHEGYA